MSLTYRTSSNVSRVFGYGGEFPMRLELEEGKRIEPDWPIVTGCALYTTMRFHGIGRHKQITCTSLFKLQASPRPLNRTCSSHGKRRGPADLPTLDHIVKSCADAGSNRNGVCIEVLGKPRFWAKYGGSITRGEGRTQAHVTGIANDPERVVRVPEVYLIFSREECG